MDLARSSSSAMSFRVRGIDVLHERVKKFNVFLAFLRVVEFGFLEEGSQQASNRRERINGTSWNIFI